MINVVIAEDEILELNALAHDIDYAALGMQVVGTACDGETALGLIKEQKPDLLITDIVMPKRSGLELLRLGRELRPDMYVIIISGHQRFDYAQLAIEYGAENFLSKPLLPEQLLHILKNISLKIRQHNRSRFEEEFFAQELKTNLPLLREMFVRSLIEGTIPEDVPKRFAFYSITLENEPLNAMCLLPEEQNDVTMLSLRRSVTSFFEEEGRGYCYAALSSTHSAALCVLFQCEIVDSPNTVCEFAERLRIAVLTGSGFSVTIGVGSAGAGWANIPSCAATAKQALEYRFYLGTGQVIAFSDISAQEHNGSPHLLRQLFSPILAAADEDDTAALEQLCDRLYLEASACSLSPQHLRILFTELMSRIISSRSASDLESLDKNDVSSLYTEMLSAETLEDMVNKIRQELFTATKSMDNYITGREKWLVKKIKEYIQSHYSENLTIDAVAGQVYISSGYAARLFRKHTGESINSYIIQTRMAAAADILKDPSVSISETADRTGYSNIAYFSSVFRKKYGYTPREWRDMHAETSDR